MACNDALEFLCRNEADKNNLKLHRASKSLCQDNAAMIAWMGWELKYADQVVDMRHHVLDSLEKIPLGSFVERPVTLNHKERSRKGLRHEGPTPVKNAL